MKITVFALCLLITLLIRTSIAYSQADNLILYVSDQDGNREIYTMSPDGSNRQRLTTNTNEDTEPAWSPDRSQIAFSSNRDGNFSIYIMNADGSNAQRVSPENRGSFHSSPAWSPTEDRIAYVSNASGVNQIHTIRVDGEEDTPLTAQRFESLDPSWSPDGRIIAFTSNPNGNYEIFSMTSSGQGARGLTVDSTVDSDSPAWSPDGTLIAFAANGGSGEIYVMNADGSNVRLLTSAANSFAGSPTWSPDGQTIAYALQGRGVEPSIRSVSIDGFSLLQLTDGTTFANFPSWSSPTPIAATGIVGDPSGETPPGGDIGVGARIQVASLEPTVPLRSSPSMNAGIVRTTPRSTTGVIIDGPQFVAEQSSRSVPQEFNWWQVELTSGEVGWMPESMYDEPVLVLADDIAPMQPVTCRLTTIQGVNIRNGPGAGNDQIASRPGDWELAADGQALGSDGIVWWRLYVGFWVRSDFVRENGDCNNLPVVGTGGRG